MDEEEPNIKKIIAIINNEKSYSIDVDETTSFYDLKKILSAAAHLLKNGFRIFYEQQEYTKDYDQNTIKEMFPDLNQIQLKIISIGDVNEYENECISFKVNINSPCTAHIGKYKLLYCLTCQKSICMECFHNDHKLHLVEEKADYLAPAQLLMNNIFTHSEKYIADPKISKYLECINIRANLKENIFNNLRNKIDELEKKINSCLEFFSLCEEKTEKNTNENLALFKKYCTESYIKLKNYINTKGIMIDDEIFLILYRKLKEIEQYKTLYFDGNKIKYENMNKLFAPFVNEINQISKDLFSNLENLLQKDIYDNFKYKIERNIVEIVQKEKVNELIFANISGTKKSHNKNSNCEINGIKADRDYYLDKDKNIKDKEKVSFSLSAEKIKNYNGKNLDKNIFSNANEEIAKTNSILIMNKTEKKIVKDKAITFDMNKKDIPIKGDNKTIEFENRLIASNSNNLNENNVSSSTNLNLINVSSSFFTNINNNNFSNKYKSNTFSHQNQITSINLDNKSNVSEFLSNNKISNDFSKNNEKNEINDFKIIDETNHFNNNNVLKEIEIDSKEEADKTYSDNKINEKIQNGLNIKDNAKGNSGGNKINNNKSLISLGTKSQIVNKKSFIILYPIFGTNYILGALDEETTINIPVNFDKFSLDKNKKLKEFPKGGAFCNYAKKLYFSGGQINNNFKSNYYLSIAIDSDNEPVANIDEMNLMLYSHSNHSMICNGNSIFVIGGINSNKCEAFDLKTLKWETMPDLISPERQQAILTIFKNYLYAFMGHTQYNILESIERININDFRNNNWENVEYTKSGNINTKFYASGVYNIRGQLFFLGGKIGLGKEERDFKSEIYRFKFDNNEFFNTDLCYNGAISFIENEFHHISEENIGNFINIDNGILATMAVSSLKNYLN